MTSSTSNLRRRGAGGDAEALDAVEAGPIDLGGALHQHGARAAGPLGHFDRRREFEQLGAPTTIRRSQRGAIALHRLLAVGRGVADVFLARADDAREPRLQHLDDGGGVVDRKRGLGDVGERVGVLRREGSRVVDGLDQDAPSRAAAGPWCRSPPGGRHGRSGGSRGQLRGGARPRDAPWRPAGRWRRDRTACARSASAGTDFGTPWAEKMTGASVSGISSSSSTKMAPLAFSALDHVAVVDDLMAHIDGRAVSSRAPARRSGWRGRRRRKSRAAPRHRWSAEGGLLAA